MGATFAIPVARWSVWPPQGESARTAPDVAFVEPVQRRRLGPLARMMLHVGHECVRDVPQARLVFASRHGELGYAVQMLRSLAAGEPLSPTLFSLAVHNAASGLFSILRADRSESTALAAGASTPTRRCPRSTRSSPTTTRSRTAAAARSRCSWRPAASAPCRSASSRPSRTHLTPS
jgi:hypothetical protein